MPKAAVHRFLNGGTGQDQDASPLIRRRTRDPAADVVDIFTTFKVENLVWTKLDPLTDREVHLLDVSENGRRRFAVASNREQRVRRVLGCILNGEQDLGGIVRHVWDGRASDDVRNAGADFQCESHTRLLAGRPSRIRRAPRLGQDPVERLYTPAYYERLADISGLPDSERRDNQGA